MNTLWCFAAMYLMEFAYLVNDVQLNFGLRINAVYSVREAS